MREILARYEKITRVVSGREYSLRFMAGSGLGRKRVRLILRELEEKYFDQRLPEVALREILVL